MKVTLMSRTVEALDKHVAKVKANHPSLKQQGKRYNQVVQGNKMYCYDCEYTQKGE